MAKTISQLTDATSVGASDEIIVQQSGVTKRATVTELKAQVATIGANDITVSGANRSITNTGNFALSFGTNNTERVRIDASGNTGVGTASPATTLDVNGDVTITDKIIHSGDTNTAIRFPANDTLAIETAGTERMRIDASGNVLIGTNNSTLGKLQVEGGRSIFAASSEQYAVGAKFSAAGGAVYFGAASASATPDAVISAAGGGALMTLTNGGNVGIGTATPTNKFDVFGNEVIARVLDSRATNDSNAKFTAQNGNGVILDLNAFNDFGVVNCVSNHRLELRTDNVTRVNVKTTGQVRFIPLSADPAGAEAGDVYYNSSDNKLKVYNGTSWVDLH
jgi:hypothetical protein